MKNLVQTLLLSLLAFSCGSTIEKQKLNPSKNDMLFDKLADRWDEAVPLGNGTVGALIWQKEDKLRFSLDRIDLWDLRPMENLNTPKYSFNWVYEQWKNDNYKEVQDTFDAPYDRSPAPSKIPAGALEFNIEKLGEVESVRLYINDAVCEVVWKNGVKLTTFVHATDPIGWYRFEGLKDVDIKPEMIMPTYALEGGAGEDSPVTGQDLRRLGYEKGSVVEGNNEIVYDQKGWNEFNYQIYTKWKSEGDTFEGSWGISSNKDSKENNPTSKEVVGKLFESGLNSSLVSHQDWWKTFWGKSSISLPDEVLEKQWYLEMYKFGSAARADAPPISLQSVWTADNGKLPPWKGDFHHDLNTQLSYWPAYSGNHLDLEKGFINWLNKYKATFKTYTKTYYGQEGINVPGVTTLTGKPMGGWIQYSFGPTVSAWLGHHFYLHWRYSMDKEFLKNDAYPWLKDTAIFIEGITEITPEGTRKLPISSSPEIHNNSREAWFAETTNFDLALIRWTYEKAAELALELNKTDEAEKWLKILNEWPQLAIDSETGFKFSPNTSYEESHRHFSHLMGFHPLGIVDFSHGEKDKKIIKNTINRLEEIGPDYWTGYSYSWLGNLKARALDGGGAAKALTDFLSFCLPNSFHVNGDQSGTGKSKFTYRPFTLEGNFAFASGIQEMLIQSHTGTVQVFPAIPALWETLSFDNLRAEGAFLVSAQRKNGVVEKIVITSEKGGEVKLKNPFGANKFKVDAEFTADDDILTIPTTVGQKIALTARH